MLYELFLSYNYYNDSTNSKARIPIIQQLIRKLECPLFNNLLEMLEGQ